jgi:hypothetical protein
MRSCLTPMKATPLLRSRLLQAALVASTALWSSPARADVIDDWNTMLLQTLSGIGSKATPPGNARSLAIVSVSMYEAANSITRTHDSYLNYINYSGSVSGQAAAAQAARDSMVSLYGSEIVTIGGISQSVTAHANSLLSTHLNTYAADPSIRANSIALGQGAASSILTDRSTDGFTAPYNYVPQSTSTPGAFQPSGTTDAWGNLTPGQFLQAQAGYMRAWGKAEVPAVGQPHQTYDRFRAAPPPALTSVEYANAFNEVKSLGSLNSTTRSADQTNIAKHWMDGPGTESPPGHWNYIAQSASLSQALDFDNKARLFALLNITNANVSIATWETKRFYDTWRPNAAINSTLDDGNPLTDSESGWAPLIGTPNFASYTSGHSAFSQGSADILELYFGTDNIAFTSTSHHPGLNSSNNQRSFTSFETAADEAGRSRIYGGIHFEFDNTAGQTIGSAIANDVFQNQLTPVPEPGSGILALATGLGLILRRRRR